MWNNLSKYGTKQSRALTEVTFKSLKENREIRQKLGGENYQQRAGIPTVTTTCIQSVLENLYIQKH